MALPEEDNAAPVADSNWDSLSDNVVIEIEKTQRELKEISLMLEQSQGDLDKLSQRNSTITMHLQQVQTQIETMPREEIKNAYDAALETQQRLVVMRSQLEKLQSDQSHLDRYLKLLGNVQKAMTGGESSDNGSSGGGEFATAEMMIQAQETERQKLSRQMHDGPAQTLSNFILQTEIAMRLFEVDQEKAKEELTSLKSAASTAFQQVRDFIYDLRPMMLDDLGLIPTVRRYIDAFREKTETEITVTVSGQEKRLESYLEVMIFRSMQELVNNSSRHSQANQIKVHLDINPDNVILMVEDDGKGFDPNSIGKDAGLGIKLIKDRSEMLGGTFEIDSAISQGSRITLSLPAVEIPEETD